jgi:2-dehydropantoate 2-reductase
MHARARTPDTRPVYGEPWHARFAVSQFLFAGFPMERVASPIRPRDPWTVPCQEDDRIVNFAIIGAGAIGAYVGAALSRGGARVTLVARGAHLEAMRTHGVRVHSSRGDFVARPQATDDIRSIGPVDVVILALKAHQIAAVVDDVRTLFTADTAVIAMQNGIPWWYFASDPGPYENRRVTSVDPDGRVGAAIEARRVIGCVIYSSTEITAPGVVKHIEGTRYSLGDPVRGIHARTQKIADAFVAGGLKAPVEADIRTDIWTKLLGNAAFNPISALTRATLGEICNDAPVDALVTEMMREALDIAAKLNVVVPLSIEKRIDGARRVGAHKTSMLQDLEMRKQFELESLVGAVVELGALCGVPVPATRHVYALAKLLERSILAGR